MEASEIDEVLFVQATVHAEEFEVEYLRGGRGAPVLLLFGAAGARRLRAALGRSLVEGFRVLAPEAARFPGEVGEVARPLALPLWLRAFLDGLGLLRVSIVADDCFGAAALGFALLEPEHVDRLVLLRGPELLAPPGAAASESFERAGRPLRVLHLVCGAGDEAADSAPARLAEEVVRFLDPGERIADQPS